MQIMGSNRNKQALWTSGKPLSGEGYIRSAMLGSVPALLRELGHDPEPLLDSVGLRLEIFEDPNVKIPFAALGRLLAQCVKVTHCEHFGLLVGERVTASMLGVTGFVMQHASDVETGLHDFIRYLQLHDRGAVANLSSSRETSCFSYSIYQENIEASEQILSGSMAVGRNIMRCLCGSSWRPDKVLFMQRRPVDLAYYKQCFNAPLRFDANQTALVFSSDWLTAVPERADPAIYRYLKQQAEQMLAASGGKIVGKLRPLLRILLMSQKCTLAEAAAQLGMHSRTLNRRLHDEGTSFRDEVAATRYVMARQLLAESELSLADVTAALGYAEVSAFAHAFKRWSGSTPGEWKERHS